MNNALLDQRYPLIKAALDRAIDNYIQSRRKKIPQFVQTHFSISGAARINKKALGTDILKAPVNVAWALPYTAIQAASAGLSKIGFKNIRKLTGKMPSGFTTAVQKEINRLIFTELLEIPYIEKSQDVENKGKEQHVPDALLAEILNQPEIQHLFQDQLAQISIQSKQEGFREALEKRLQEYAVSRIAVSELSGNIIALATGVGVFSKMTPGGISFGAGMAAAIAQQSAISSFILGPGLGGLYYGMFPATASLGLAIGATSSVLAVLAIFSAFSGVITDPLQAKFGVHEKRLNRLVDSIENSLMERDDAGLRLRGQYVVRVFDLFDMLKAAANTLV